MQTISTKYTVSDEDKKSILRWKSIYSSIVRSAYTLSKSHNINDVKQIIDQRFQSTNIGSWLTHMAVREGLDIRSTHEDKKIIFGGKKDFIRRQKNLITNEEWRLKRLRPLFSSGETRASGNRIFRLSEDGSICWMTINRQTIELRLADLRGNWNRLIKQIAILAKANEISLTFRLDHKFLHISFDEKDLRKLPPGVSLQMAKDHDADIGLIRKKGRPRQANYIPPKTKNIYGIRPVHHEWKEQIVCKNNRAVGIDINPNWIGITAVEFKPLNPTDLNNLKNIKILDYRLIHFGLGQQDNKHVMRELLAKTNEKIINLCRSWNVGVVYHENGLGRLRAGGRNRSLNRLINGWGRQVLLSNLQRKCNLANIQLKGVWGGYSTTIGNLSFEIPDACAAAGEIARRGHKVFISNDYKNVIPRFDVDSLTDIWKKAVKSSNVLGNASNWVDVHGLIKTSQDVLVEQGIIGYRRPHHDNHVCDSHGRTVILSLSGHAVENLKNRKIPGFIMKRVENMDGMVNRGVNYSTSFCT